MEDILKLKKDLEKILYKINRLRTLEFLSYCPVEKDFYKNRIMDMIDDACFKIDDILKILNEYPKRDLKEFTLDELSQFDGRDGRPAYVAINGVVYDVTFNEAWAGGSHFGLLAGKDLTEEFNKCHDLNKLLKLEIVGKIKESNV
ncbi:Predicted heme/steroid binding protein [Caloramator fervidus]|uniref:Predicted heme/steroid binding protein n=1 Tax=Caloramator fervidus TaxID=29344 RepID=A0A1H5VME1_9CLOT|nr:cytochrome b5 domain-containing protein [Caloramator fervidus]SEF88186.1 Predicted heme/steroid binding protein [Caloramator fervidus]